MGKSRAAARRLGMALITSLPVAILASACASIPSSGPVQSTPTPPAPGLSGAVCCGMIVSGPQPGWDQEDVVRNFLLASANFSENHAIARKYLTAAANRDWRPQSQLTILAQQPTVHLLSQHVAGSGGPTVLVTGEQVATLDASGHYIPAAPGSSPQTREQYFGMQWVNHRWYIATMPSTGLARVSHELALTTSLFQSVYEPRNVYYYARRNQALVPDPVFLPTGSADQVQTLIDDLRGNPGDGLLNGAAVTAFPPGTRLLGVQVVPGPGKTAIVDLGVPAGTRPAQLQAMAKQLVLTLTSPAWNSPPLFQAVKIKVNGRSWRSAQRLADYRHYLPLWRPDPAVYFDAPDGRVRMLGRLAPRSVQVPGEAGTGGPPLNGIAVSPDGRQLAGVDPTGQTLYTASLAAGGQSATASGDLRVRLQGSGLSAPGWDVEGDLWAAGRVNHVPGLWVLAPGQSTPVQVAAPRGIGRITGFAIAPDGVRIAMIAGRGASAHLLLGAIVGDGVAFQILQVLPVGSKLAGVTAVAWYDEGDLLAISQGHLWEVPVSGVGATATVGVPGMVSIASAGPGSPLYLGLSNGRLDKSVGLGEPWTDATAGRNPTYPG